METCCPRRAKQRTPAPIPPALDFGAGSLCPFWNLMPGLPPPVVACAGPPTVSARFYSVPSIPRAGCSRRRRPGAGPRPAPHVAPRPDPNAATATRAGPPGRWFPAPRSLSLSLLPGGWLDCCGAARAHSDRQREAKSPSLSRSPRGRTRGGTRGISPETTTGPRRQRAPSGQHVHGS